MKPPRLVSIAFAIMFVLAVGSLLVRSMQETLRGNGAGAYENNYGMVIHWITPISLTAALVVAFVVSVVIRWWQTRDDRAIARLLAKRSKAQESDTKEP